MPMRRTLAVVLVLFVAGCGEEAGNEPRDAADTAETTAEPQRLFLTISQDNDTVKGRTVLLTGDVSEPGATIDVDGEKEATANANGVFRVRLRLPELGENAFRVEATKPGFDGDSQTISITRERTARELAAVRARRRERRERELADLRTNAKPIPPRQLQKNPDSFAGERIVISGEIFQIQEGGDNFFLMNTECETEFDITICDGPSVYVTYDFSIPQAEEDLVTVYGTVQGGYDYETQAGGSNFVGHVEARIIE